MFVHPSAFHNICTAAQLAAFAVVNRPCTNRSVFPVFQQNKPLPCNWRLTRIEGRICPTLRRLRFSRISEDARLRRCRLGCSWWWAKIDSHVKYHSFSKPAPTQHCRSFSDFPIFGAYGPPRRSGISSLLCDATAFALRRRIENIDQTGIQFDLSRSRCSLSRQPFFSGTRFAWMEVPVSRVTLTPCTVGVLGHLGTLTTNLYHESQLSTTRTEQQARFHQPSWKTFLFELAIPPSFPHPLDSHPQFSGSFHNPKESEVAPSVSYPTHGEHTTLFCAQILRMRCAPLLFRSCIDSLLDRGLTWPIGRQVILLSGLHLHFKLRLL